MQRHRLAPRLRPPRSNRRTVGIGRLRSCAGAPITPTRHDRVVAVAIARASRLRKVKALVRIGAQPETANAPKVANPVAG